MEIEDLIDEYIDIWSDALSCAEDWTERNLVNEFLENLRELKRLL